MGDRPTHATNESNISQLQSERGCIIGLQAHCNGMVSFTGVYHTFMIQFKANGFNKLFRMPATAMVNKIFYVDEVLGAKAKDVNEQLRNAIDIQQMAHFADSFLLFFLNRQKAYLNVYDGITFISNHLFNQASLLSIEQYACKANMSVRNFGRKFADQTGVSPKLYCRLFRFNNAINKKLKHPQVNWTAIAYDCGYYDQMHMIKDFKEFANVNPSALFKRNTKFTRPRNDGTDVDTHAIMELNNTLFEETFIVVTRTIG